MELPSLLGSLRSVFPLLPPVRKEQQEVEERRLALNEVWSVDPQRGETLTVECLTGACWISRTGDSEDVLLQPGESCIWPGSGRVVAQAMTSGAWVLIRTMRKGRAHVR
jgi:hypothetical protein